MGVGNSKLEKALAESNDDERFFGLENFGNTCYCNSVLQALYFCKPFRERLLQYAAERRGSTDDLPSCLADLFYQVMPLAALRGHGCAWLHTHACTHVRWGPAELWAACTARPAPPARCLPCSPHAAR